MLSLARRVLHGRTPASSCLQGAAVRQFRTEAGSSPPKRRRPKLTASAALRKREEKSEWWVVDGEMHEIGEKVAPRERFVIPRDNIPNKRRKQLRDQFMRRTRLVLKESVLCSSFFFLFYSTCFFSLPPLCLSLFIY